MSRLHASLFALALCLAAPRAQATPLPRSGRFQLSIPVEVLWHTDPGYEVFRRSHTGGPGVMFSLDVTPLSERLVIGVDVGYRREDFESSFASSLTSHLNSDWLTAGVSARYAVTRFIEPYARLSGGAMHSHVAIESPNTSLEDDNWTPFGALGGGVMLRSAAFAYNQGLGRLGFSFALEGGYLLALPTEYSLAPPRPQDDEVAADQLPVRATRIGAINASGAYFRAVFGLRF